MARSIRIAGDRHRVAADEAKVWLTSTESLATVLSAGNRELLRIIADQAPGSLDELAEMTWRARSNLSRTLKATEGYAFCRRPQRRRIRIAPHLWSLTRDNSKGQQHHFQRNQNQPFGL